MAYQYAKLRELILTEYESYSLFAQKIGVSKQTVSAKLNRRSQFSQEDIFKWSKALDLSLSEARAYFFE